MWNSLFKNSFKFLGLITIGISLSFCSNEPITNHKVQDFVPIQTPIKINPDGQTIAERFPTPVNCIRVDYDASTFGYYLRELKLKPYGTKVYYYNGGQKNSEGIYCSVIDMTLGDRDLQQCADAVMRLKAEHLYQEERFEEIRFNFLSDGKPRYFNKYSNGKQDRKTFDKYLNHIFSYANTASLSEELKSVEDIAEIDCGNVFIQKGNPYGHAIIVVDLCVDTITQRKFMMLAQSYMPAQDTQILINPNDEQLSPWYAVKQGVLTTPEWTFSSKDLKKFDY